MQQWLTITNVKTWTFPLPDNYIEIVWISKQWYVWDNVTRIINISWKTSDPKDDSLYSYSIDYTWKKIQLAWFLEENNTVIFSQSSFLINHVLASSVTDYTKRFTYTVWDRVWILLDSVTKAPINEILPPSTTQLNLPTDSNLYIAIFSNSSSNSWTITWSWINLQTNISIIQNSCVLWNTAVTSGKSLQAFSSNSVPYNQTCISITRNCSNWVLDWDKNYKFDSCAPSTPLNCNAITYNWYEIPMINHNSTNPTITKQITWWVADISASCENWILSYWTENINCSANYVLDNWACMQDICTWSAPDFSIANWTQKYNILWLHSTTPKDCSYICQAWYYYNTNICIPASIWNMVPTEWLSTQTPCTDNNTYQDTTWQTSCKTIQSWYYSTPIWTWPKTSQAQCEANNYCINWVKTSCAIWYSSPAWSTNINDCNLNTYTVSWSFWANANWATINVCWKTATADTNWNFSITADYGTNCNNATATITGYTCTTTTNWPTSLTSDINNIAWNCIVNTQTSNCTWLPSNASWNTASNITQTWNWSTWTPSAVWIYSLTASTTNCNFKCNDLYNWNSTTNTCDPQPTLQLTWRVWTTWYGNADLLTNFYIVSTWNYSIDWWDGNTEIFPSTTKNPIHTYAIAWYKVISITWNIQRFYTTTLNNSNYAWKLISVNKWDNIVWTSMQNMFRYANNFNSLPTTAPNLANVTDMSSMFYNTSVFNQPIWNWDTSNVTTMASMFGNADAFNQNISTWNTSNVTSMASMFSSTTAFNQPIWNWDTSNVTTMTNMFFSAKAFNQNISTWNTSNVTSMKGMFRSANAFNQPIWNWDTSKVTNMSQMFQLASIFNQNISTWNTSNVIDMSLMFYSASIFNQPIWNWDTSKVTNMNAMFTSAKAFNQNISTWNTGNVANMNYIFQGATVFNQNLGGWVVNPNTTTCTAFNNNATAWVLAKPGFISCTP